MSEMIDRVSNAICAVSGEFIGVPLAKLVYDDMARAAIAAMREPTEAMLEALAPYCSQGPLDPGTRDATRAWDLAIDAALKDGGLK
jgi:hypothetical protein